jgi:Dolichyl-phosphate-mannose-protein mannosyltransferase
MTTTCDDPSDEGQRPPFESWADEKDHWFNVFLLIGMSVCFVHATYFLWVGIAGPALDLFSFRQTQTAISAYWAWREGFRLAYQTPVLGFPWSIPFEFPIYQWLMVLARYAGVPFDIGGRLLSFGFYIASLLPLLSVTRSLKLDRSTFLIIGVLFLSSPLYIFWSRTILIESCALFFALAWFAMLLRFMNRPNCRKLVGTTILGSVAVLAKATTFPAFDMLGGLLILSGLRAIWREKPSAPSLRTLIFATLASVVPLCVEYAWVIYTDAVKMLNPVGALLTSSQVSGFAFGTLDQRFSVELWRDVIFARVLHDTFGYGFLVALVAGGALLTSRRRLLGGFAAVAAFLLPFLLFTNLHIVHSYYQYANAIFALAATGLAIGYIAKTGRRVLASLILIAVALGQLVYFHNTYAPVFNVDFRQIHTSLIAQLTKQNTSPDDGLLVIGQDFASDIPYYSERKALAVPSWTPRPMLEKILTNPQAFLGGLRLGAVVYCTDLGFGDRSPLVNAFVAQRSVIAEAGTCQLLSAEARP